MGQAQMAGQAPLQQPCPLGTLSKVESCPSWQLLTCTGQGYSATGDARYPEPERQRAGAGWGLPSLLTDSPEAVGRCPAQPGPAQQ